MLRAHAGIVTALIDDDAAAVSTQVRAILDDQLRAADGDFAAFTQLT